MQMSDQAKLLIHFLISKLFIVAPPLLNGVLAPLGIKVTTGSATADTCADLLIMGIGIAYSWWVKNHAAMIHTNIGFVAGVTAATTDASLNPNPSTDPIKTIPSPIPLQSSPSSATPASSKS